MFQKDLPNSHKILHHTERRPISGYQGAKITQDNLALDLQHSSPPQITEVPMSESGLSNLYMGMPFSGALSPQYPSMPTFAHSSVFALKFIPGI